MAGEAAKFPVEITYIGNEGFIITAGNKKVAVDALFSGFSGRYTVPAFIQKQMRKAQSPFNGIDLILVTHMHADHINPTMVGEHIKNSTRTVCVAPNELVRRMPALFSGFYEIEDRFRAIFRKPELNFPDIINGINLDTLILLHGRNSVHNIGFIFILGGQKIFHMGDSYGPSLVSELKTHAISKKHIDIAFVPYWYLKNQDYAKIIKENLKARHIVAMHLAVRDGNESLNNTLKGIRQHFPQAIIFSKEMEKRTLL